MKNALINLLKVKTLITLPIVGVLCYLSIIGKIETEQFISITTVIIMFYFTKKEEIK